MYDKNDKRRLYWLIDQYLSGQIDESIFCDEFYYSYDLEIESNTLDDTESMLFAKLSQVSSRFSKYQDDHELDPNAFSTIEELKQKIIETREKLKQH